MTIFAAADALDDRGHAADAADHREVLPRLGQEAQSLVDLAGGPRPGMHTLYVSPLKALAADPEVAGLIHQEEEGDDAWKKAEKAVPLGRSGTVEELLAGFRTLVENPYVTGQVLSVDGGRHLKGDLFGSI